MSANNVPEVVLCSRCKTLSGLSVEDSPCQRCQLAYQVWAHDRGDNGQRSLLKEPYIKPAESNASNRALTSTMGLPVGSSRTTQPDNRATKNRMSQAHAPDRYKMRRVSTSRYFRHTPSTAQQLHLRSSRQSLRIVNRHLPRQSLVSRLLSSAKKLVTRTGKSNKKKTDYEHGVGYTKDTRKNGPVFHVAGVKSAHK